MTLKDVLKEEFIGLHVHVIDARNEANKGIKGIVVDETRSMFTISTQRKEKKLIKHNVTLRVSIKGKTYDIDGSLLVGRPEDRLKKRVKL